ncbi:MAG: phosphotransferase [Acidobacteriota bacterium]
MASTINTDPARLERLRSRYPGKFFLTSDLPTVAAYLTAQKWLAPHETLQQVVPAGTGNMNCVLRVVTSLRSFILKQSRPWVEKYPDIPAPWDRALIEAKFYRATARSPQLQGHLPHLIAVDSEERLLMLEDLDKAQDFTSLYSGVGSRLTEPESNQLIDFLIALHTSIRAPGLRNTFSNEAMRALNHEHIFEVPLRRRNGLNLDAITPGLSGLAQDLQNDGWYCREVAALGARYLDRSSGECLIHGDYFPGSWLSAREQVFIIDPEFCFFGLPEWDLAVMAAHLSLTGHSPAEIDNGVRRYTAFRAVDHRLVNQFAGIEIMRRLIGVAQLPVLFPLERKAELLSLSRALVLEGRTA